MPRFSSFSVTCTVLAFLVTCDKAAPGFAQEFRIETNVYLADAEQPASHTVTLFEKSAVYEFVDDPEQVVVFRTGSEGGRGQFILLDPATKQRTDVDVARVHKLMEKMSRWAAEQKDPLLKFAAAPNFEESYDADSGSLTLASPQWNYRAATIEA